MTLRRTPMKRTNMKRLRIPASIRLFVMDRDGWQCAYGGCLNPTTIDHIVPKGDRRRAGIDDLDATYMVACCLDHNHLKGTRRLVPPSWEPRVGELSERVGRSFRVWHGDPAEEAFRAVHK